MYCSLFSRDACVVQVVGDRDVYNNELIYAEHDPVYTFIIKHYKWTVGVECEVQRDGRTYGERLTYLLNPLRPLWGIGHQPLFAILAGPEPLL